MLAGKLFDRAIDNLINLEQSDFNGWQDGTIANTKIKIQDICSTVAKKVWNSEAHFISSLDHSSYLQSWYPLASQEYFTSQNLF